MTAPAITVDWTEAACGVRDSENAITGLIAQFVRLEPDADGFFEDQRLPERAPQWAEDRLAVLKVARDAAVAVYSAEVRAAYAEAQAARAA